MLSTNELLKPRYKVIADYPGSVWEVGTIIPNEYHAIKILTTQSIAFYEAYNHLFKKLEWWEERKVEDMPEYVKIPHYPNGEKDFSMVHVDGDLVKHDFTQIGYFGLKYKYHGGGTIVTMFTPATEKEYLEYQSLNQIK